MNRGGSTRKTTVGANTSNIAKIKKKKKRKNSNESVNVNTNGSGNATSNEQIDSDIPSDVPAIRSRPTNDTNKFTNKTRSNDGDHSSGSFYMILYGHDYVSMDVTLI